jgi:hypothetical protein
MLLSEDLSHVYYATRYDATMHPPSISGPPVTISAHKPNRPWKIGLTILGCGDQQARINSKWNTRKYLGKIQLCCDFGQTA